MRQSFDLAGKYCLSDCVTLGQAKAMTELKSEAEEPPEFLHSGEPIAGLTAVWAKS